MRILIPFDHVIRYFEDNDDRQLTDYIWRFYDKGIRGVIEDWLVSSRSLSYYCGGIPRSCNGNVLGDHLVFCYDSWVEKNQPVYGVSPYEYNKDITRLYLIGQLLEELLDKHVYMYFRHELKKIKIKSCRWVTKTVAIVEVDL